MWKWFWRCYAIGAAIPVVIYSNTLVCILYGFLLGHYLAQSYHYHKILGE